MTSYRHPISVLLGTCAIAGFAALALPSMGRAAAAPPSNAYARLLEQGSASVVGVRFQMRPKERPKGGEGAKIKRVVVGVVAGAPGEIVISGDPFPDIDDGPDAMEPFDFQIVLPGDVEVPAETMGIDRELNFGFLKADPARLDSLRPVAFDRTVEAAVGDEVVVIGLLSEEYGLARTFYAARINAIVEKSRRMYSLDIPLQDLAIGGLVLLKDGRPLGIIGEDVLPEAPDEKRATNVLSLIGPYNQGPRLGYPFVFPFPDFSRSLATPPNVQPENRGWLGIVMQPLSKDLAEYWKIPADGGIIVGAVIDDSPAAAAGLMVGDVILQVDGQDLPVHEQSDLPLMQRRIRAAGAGRAVPIAIWRDGAVKALEVRLASSPVTMATAEEYENETFGIKVRALSYDFLQSANLDRTTAGVIVTDLERAGWAQVSGIGRYDIIQKVGGEATPDIATFKAVMEKAVRDKPAELVLFVLRDYQTQFVRVKTNWPKP